MRLLYIPKLPLTELFCLTLDLERMGFVVYVTNDACTHSSSTRSCLIGTFHYMVSGLIVPLSFLPLVGVIVHRV